MKSNNLNITSFVFRLQAIFYTKFCLVFLTALVLSCDDHEPLILTRAIKAAPDLTFNKLIVKKKSITAAELLKQIPEKEKEGYALKNISIEDPSIVLEGEKPNFILNLKKIGTFTIHLVLEKKGYDDTLIPAEIELSSEKFIFRKLITAKRTLTSRELLPQIQGGMKGYTLKNILINDASFGTVSGAQPNFTLHLIKEGVFTAVVTLEKKGYADANITAAIELAAERFSFT